MKRRYKLTAAKGITIKSIDVYYKMQKSRSTCSVHFDIY